MRLKLIFLIIFIPFFSASQESVNSKRILNEIVSDLDQYMVQVSHHKLYLHTNKDHYNSGDVIWFKAYLLEAVSHKPDTNDVNINVELINSEGVVMGKRLLLSENGIAIGDMDLPVSLPDDNYMLRAYTDRMKNFDESFYFTKYLYINNPGFKNSIPRIKVWSNRRFNRQLERMKSNFEIAFYPEGGALVEGIPVMVAFKSFDELGQGVRASGKIINSNGDVVADIESGLAGNGSFTFTPLAGESYVARVSFRGGRSRVFDLPEVQTSGVVMKVRRANDSLSVGVASRSGTGNAFPDDEVLLVAHSGGEHIYGEVISLDNGEGGVSIPDRIFPSGVASFTVFSTEARPLAQRLFLVYHDDDFHFFPAVVKQVVDDREHFGLIIEVSDKDNNPVHGSFSVSFLTGETVYPGLHDNIVSYMLLSSDVKGIVESPVSCFDTINNADASSDFLLAHEWERFSWETVLSEGHTEPDSTTAGITITGKLTEPAGDQSLGNFPVELVLGDDDSEVFTTNTNRRGIFEFNELVFYDETRATFSSQRLKEDYPPDIELFRTKTEGYDYIPNMHTRKKNITSRGNNWKRVSRVTSSPYSEAPELKALPGLYGRPDQTILIDLNNVRQNTVYEVLLHRAKGLDFDGGRIVFRGRTDLLFEREPMFMLDGVRTGRNVVLELSPLDVQRIEIFRGTSKAAFGSSGSSGVIIAYSRRAADEGFSDKKEYTLMGYHTPNDFYSDIPVTTSGVEDQPFAIRTIKWDPEVVTDSAGQALIPIPSIEGLGPVRLVIEGVGFEGGFGSDSFILNFDK